MIFFDVLHDGFSLSALSFSKLVLFVFEYGDILSVEDCQRLLSILTTMMFAMSSMKMTVLS